MTTNAGALAREFGSGYEGIAWGDSLEELVKIHPGGDHFFEVGWGARDYAFLDERPIFGISRNRMCIGPSPSVTASTTVSKCYGPIVLVQNLYAGMSLAASTGSLMLHPLYVTAKLLPSVVARPLQGEPPTIDLVMGYSKSNTSSLLKRFLLRIDELVAGVQKVNSKAGVNRTASKRHFAKAE